MLLSGLLACTLCAAPPTPLDQVVALLTAKKCDDAFLMLAKVQAPSPPTPEGRKAARPVAKGAGDCLKEDPMLGLALSTLAMKLAPEELEVQIGHAEALVAVKETNEAAVLLAGIVKANSAKQAPAAWFLLADLAHQGRDDAQAVQLLTPLAAEPAWKARAAPLLAQAKAALAQRGDEVAPPELPTPGAKPSGPTGPAPRSGEVIAKFPNSIQRRGKDELKVRGLVPGRPYVFRATGTCERELKEFTDEEGNVYRRRGLADVFGLDFRVQFGSSASRSLSMGTGGKREENRIEFVAEEAEMRIRVFDESSVDDDVACTLDGFSVVAR